MINLADEILNGRILNSQQKDALYQEISSRYPGATHKFFSQFLTGQQKNSYEVMTENILGSAPRILDLGCAQGEVLPYLPPNVHYTGIDISSSEIEKARKNSKNYRHTDFMCKSATSLNLNEHLYDHIISHLFLHLLDDPTSLIDKSCSALTAKGRLIAVIRDPGFEDLATQTLMITVKNYFSKHFPDFDFSSLSSSSEAILTYCHAGSSNFNKIEVLPFTVQSEGKDLFVRLILEMFPACFLNYSHQSNLKELLETEIATHRFEIFTAGLLRIEAVK